MKERKQSITALLKRIEKVEYELSDIRKCIAEYMTPPAADGGEATDVKIEFTYRSLSN